MVPGRWVWALVATAGMAAAQDAPAPAAEEPVVRLGAVERVTVWLKRKLIVVEGEITLRRGPVELLACARGGKTHESVLLLHCRPSDLDAALQLLECKYTSGPTFFGDPTTPVGDRLICEVEWTLDGKLVRRRLETLAWDARVGRAMPDITWVYVGSKFARDPRTGADVYMADVEKNLVASYHDPHALLDNPLPSGGDDTSYVANSEVLPPRGTTVRLTIRRATAEEIAASALIEAAAEKEAAERRAAEAKAREEEEKRAEEERKGGGEEERRRGGEGDGARNGDGNGDGNGNGDAGSEAAAPTSRTQDAERGTWNA